MKIKHTLVRQFTVIILLILAVGQGILYTWLLFYQKSYLTESLHREMTAIAREIASTVAAQGADQGPLEQAVSLLFAGGRVLSVRAVDAAGRTILERSAPPAPSEDNEQNALTLSSFFSIPPKNTVSVPLPRGGSVEVSFSGKPVNEVMRRFLIIPPLMQSFTFLVVIYAIILFFRRKVSSPVKSINAALSRITEGDLVAEVPDIGDNELGSIATGAKFLVERLSTTLTRFHSLSSGVVAALEKLVSTLTVVRDATSTQAAAIDRVIPLIHAANEQQRGAVESTDNLSRSTHDDTSSLFEMKAAAEEIAASTERLFRSAEGSYAMVSAMSQTTQRIADGSNEVFPAVEDTSASVQEINTSLAAVRENARKSSEVSSRVRLLLTDRGTLAVADAIEAMEKIAAEVGHFEQVITRLDDQSKDIEKVLSVIDDVTDKTNLLSLNASILAAQAGEHGKGFSVVAAGIRALSEGATSSARDIARIVGMIQSQIREAVEAIHTGVKTVEEGKSLLFKTGQAMGETLEAAQQSAQMTALVEKAAEEQAVGLRQIQLAMENIRSMFEQVAKSTEEERRSSTLMLENIAEVKAVAELVRKGTGEHVAGTKAISKNLEMSRDNVSRVHQAAQHQLKTNEDIVGAVDQIKRSGLAAIKDLEELSRSFGALQNEVDALKKEIVVFRTRRVAATPPPNKIPRSKR
jgi:methyl-accepting chemotaxis protein